MAGLTASCTDRATLNTVEIGGHRLAGQAITDAVGQTVGFAGIRYAQAPTGERRWRPPLPVDHEPGDYLHVFPPICPQDNGNIEWYQEVARAFGHDASVVQTRPEISEDCLFLNVWTPDLSGANPVMVWIHGGSNVNGYSYEPNYLGHRLAARGVVVVSIQYRLGVFGFLAHPELSAESPHASSGNYAILDQLEALRWVRANIAAFGGDPGNVTVFGESAGAGNIAYLVVSPQSQGLFHRAISQSGGWPQTQHRTLGDDEKLGEAFLADMNVASIAELRDAPMIEVLETAKASYEGYSWDPAIDGWLIPQAPARSLSEGSFVDAELMIGTNADEWLMYLPDDSTEADWDALLAETLEDEAARTRVNRMLGALPLAERMDKLTTAGMMRCPSLAIAHAYSQEGQSVYVYEFSRVRVGMHGLGAYHGAEIPYVFDTHDDWLPTSEDDEMLTQSMMGYWVAFAHSGDPNGNGRPPWPAFGLSGQVLSLDIAMGTIRLGEPSLCTLLQ